MRHVPARAGAMALVASRRLIAARRPTWARTGGRRRGRGAGSRRSRASGARRRAVRRHVAPLGEDANDADGGRRTTGAACPGRRGTGARRRRPGSGEAGATLARRAIVADAATASGSSALTYHPTGENPRKRAKLGRVNTVARRALPHGLPHPGRSTLPSWSCMTGTAPRCCRCRRARRQRRAGRRDQRSGRRLGALDARSPGNSCRARRARRGARGR